MMGGGNGQQQQQQVVAVPPGFRFHPTDEELLYYYLRKKISYESIDLDVIREVDLNKLEPWDLKERCRIGSGPQNEWYFFSHKDKKYPTGTRTNRATTAGFWKATGRDKAIHQQQEQHVTSSSRRRRIGMRKTLVFYTGRAPHGQKTDWIMHEYRLLDHDPNPEAIQEEGWVVCRVFKKKNPNRISSSTLFPNSQPGEDEEADQRDHHQLAAAHNGDSNNHHNSTPKQSFLLQLQAQAATAPPPYVNYSNNSPHHPNYNTCTHFGGTTNYNHSNNMIMHLPQLLTSPDHHDHPTSAEGPIGGHLVMMKMNNHDNLQDPSSTSNNSCSTGCAGGVQLNIDHDHPHSSHSHFTNYGVAAADWSFLDKLLASHNQGGLGLGHVQGLGRLDHQSKFNVQLQQIPLVLGRDDDHHAPPPPTNLSDQIFPFQYLGHQT